MNPCGHGKSSLVTDSRPGKGMTIRRRRECSKCGRRWTTYEVLASNYKAVLPFIGHGAALERLLANLTEVARLLRIKR